MESPLWSVKYRPSSWDEFLGQDVAVSSLRNLAGLQTCPNLILLGPYGTGKSSAALVFARALLGEVMDSNFLYLNVRDVTMYPITKAKRTIQDLAKLERSERTPLDEYMSTVYRAAKDSMKVRGEAGEPNRSQMLLQAITLFASTMTVAQDKVKLLVLDEADALSIDMQQALRRTMEVFSEVCRFVFITPSLSGWVPALISRCVVLKFSSIEQSVIERQIQSISEREGVRIDDLAVRAIARACDGDLRRAINLLQVCSASGKTVTEDTVYEQSETPLQRGVREAVTLAVDGSYVESRNRVRRLVTIEGYSEREVLHEIGAELMKRPFSPKVRSAFLDRVSELDYRMVEARNQFIHLSAMLASIWRMSRELSS
ncbi:MAG: AAA family ATPase [Candidatus Thorarchaeota archaeon]|nr:AAA family ATPase [Candidatus Thorarchaeota archaeon]